MAKRTAVNNLKDALVASGYDYISNKGYEALIDSHMIEDQDQAETLASIIRDVADVAYTRGYREGQIYQKGFDDAAKNSESN